MEKTKTYLLKEYKKFEDQYYDYREKYQTTKKELEQIQSKLDHYGGLTADAHKQMEMFEEMIKEMETNKDEEN